MADDTAARAVRVFVSYVAGDRHWADGYLLPALADAGVTATTEAGFTPGRPRMTEFEAAITSSDWIVLVLTQAYLADGRAEIVDLMAQHYGMDTGTWPVIPLILQRTELPLRLRMLGSLDATEADRWADVVERLIRTIGLTWVIPPPPPECPYPGMAGFGRAQSSQFVGRELEVEDASARLLGGARGLSIVGRSGSGKSSLMLAGVVPRLEDRGWRVLIRRPAEVADAPVSPGMGDGGRALLVIDQLEELFALDPTAYETVCNVVDAWQATAGRAVGVTLRADFYPQVMASRLWPLIRDYRLELLPMDDAGIRRAITVPALDVDVFVEPALVERLVADAAGEPGSLPLLQETLVLLWEHLERRMLPLAAYEAFVLPRRHYGEPPRNALQIAIARRADRVLAELDDVGRGIARRIFVRLVHFEDARLLRRRQRVRDLRVVGEDDKRFDAVLDHLAAARLLTLGAEASTDLPTADLAHEALISGWPTFAAWLDDRRAHEGMRRRLESKATEWRRLGSQDGGLLDEIELAEAQRWLEGHDEAEREASADLSALITASRETIEARAAEEARRHAEQLATQRRLAETRRQAARRLGLLSVVLAALFIAALVLLVWVNQERRAAEQARIAAERARIETRSSEIASIASALPDELVDRAMVLGAAAFHLRDDTRTRSGLLAAVTSNQSVVRQFHADAPVRALAVVAGGAVAVGDRWGEIDLRDLATGRSLRDLHVPPPTRTRDGAPIELRSLAAAPDGRTLAAGTTDGRVSRWDVSSGSQLAPDHQHTGSVRALAFGPDGHLASGDAPTGDGGDTAGVIVVRTPNGDVRRLTEHRDWVNALVFTPDGRRLISAGGSSADRSQDHRIIVWDTATWTVETTLDLHRNAVRGLAVSDDGSLLASADADNQVMLWDLRTFERTHVLSGHDERVFSVAFLEGGSLVASASRDHTIRIWDTATGRQARAPLLGHEQGVGVVVAAGDRLVSGADDGRTIVWDPVGPRQRLAALVDHRDDPTLAVTAGGDRVAVGAGDGTVVVRATDDAAAPVRIDAGGPVRSLAFDATGRRLASTTAAGALQVWDAVSGVSVAGPVDSGDRRASVTFVRGRELVTGGSDATLTLWDDRLRSPQVVYRHVQMITGVASLEPDRVLTVGADGQLVIHELGAGDPVSTVLDPLGGQLTAVAVLAPDGMAITGDTDQRLRMWDPDRPADDSLQQVVTGHAGQVTAVAAAETGHMVASGDHNGMLLMWDVTGGRLRPLGSPIDVGARIANLAFADDGGTLVIATSDGTTRWLARPADWVRTACTVAGRDLTTAERELFAPDLDDLTVCRGPGS